MPFSHPYVCHIIATTTAKLNIVRKAIHISSFKSQLYQQQTNPDDSNTSLNRSIKFSIFIPSAIRDNFVKYSSL